MTSLLDADDTILDSTVNPALFSTVEDAEDENAMIPGNTFNPAPLGVAEDKNAMASGNTFFPARCDSASPSPSENAMIHGNTFNPAPLSIAEEGEDEDEDEDEDIMIPDNTIGPAPLSIAEGGMDAMIPGSTGNPALFSTVEDAENTMIPGNAPQSDDSSSVNNSAMSVLEADASSLFESPNNTPTRPGTAAKENTPQNEGTGPTSQVEPSSESLQPVDRSDLLTGLSTPLSDPPSPATPAPKKTNRCKSKPKRSLDYAVTTWLLWSWRAY